MIFNIPNTISTFLISMLPIIELRAGIPFGIESGLSWQSAFFWAALGNIIAAFLVLLLLDPVSKFLRKHFNFFERFFSWLFARTHRKHSQKIEVWGLISLMLFVAIPLPGTGAWTGAVIAYIFGIDLKKAFALISLGILIAGIIMTIGWTGIMAIIRL